MVLDVIDLVVGGCGKFLVFLGRAKVILQSVFRIVAFRMRASPGRLPFLASLIDQGSEYVRY